jgi:glycosyltransferase involved in cell wall biosynthesis
MKICLVTTFPPSQGGLSEYGLHIAQELQRNPLTSLSILADEISTSLPEIDGFSVERCWSFDDPLNSVRLLRALHRLKPDVVWFNLLFSTFGHNPLIAFSGLMTPLLARLSGRYTHVTLHHLMDTVDLKDVGIRFPRTYRLAGSLATRMLLLANSVSVLMPGYRRILDEKYGGDNVHVRSHGILTRRPEYPDFSRRGNPDHRILAFGKWGTYKRLELMLEAFEMIQSVVPNAKLVIGGGNHPQAAGYVESVREKCEGNPRIEFTGYVDEDLLPALFQSSSVAVMPYSSSTGCSGVAHLACAYGVPIVCSDLADFRQMADGEELAIEFYEPGNSRALADCLIRFLKDPEKQQTMAVQNFAAGLRMTMPNIVQKYLRHFELQQRAEALRYVTRFRRLPNWVPSKSLLLRAMTKNTLGWAQRSALPRAPLNLRAGPPLVHGNGHDRGELGRARVPAHGYGIGIGKDGVLSGGNFPSTGGPPETYSDQANEHESANGKSAAPALHVSDESDAGYSEGKNSGRIDGVPLPIKPIHPANGNGRNGNG